VKPTQRQISKYYGVTERTLRNWDKATCGRQHLLEAAKNYYMDHCFNEKKANEVHINQTLNRDDELEEAVFLSIVGMNDIKSGSKLTGAFHIEGAIIMLQRIVKQIEKEYQEFGG